MDGHQLTAKDGSEADSGSAILRLSGPETSVTGRT
jgi:hypothetical protein